VNHTGGDDISGRSREKVKIASIFNVLFVFLHFETFVVFMQNVFIERIFKHKITGLMLRKC
jgi:hypothetical protein